MQERNISSTTIVKQQLKRVGYAALFAALPLLTEWALDFVTRQSESSPVPPLTGTVSDGSSEGITPPA